MDRIKELLNNNDIDKAIELLELSIADNKNCDEAYFMLGNAYCKKNNWQQAMNAYCQAIELNPESPAQMAYNHLQDIMKFFNHDLYNP